MDHFTDEGTENAFATLVETRLQACGGFAYLPYIRALHGKEETTFQAGWIIYFEAS